MKESQLKLIEDHAFYISGLCADGCLEKLDDYTKKAIETYGRVMIKSVEQKFNEEIKKTEAIKEVAKKLYGVALHLNEVSNQYPVITIGPNTKDEMYRAVKKYEECKYLHQY